MIEKSLRITPVDLGVDGKPRDGKLATAVQEYAKKEFGREIDFTYYVKVWAILATRVVDAEYYEVIGITAIRNQADCQVFHITAPTEDREGAALAMQARDMAVMRMYGYLEDLGMRGSTVLIYVSEKAQPFWKKFLNRIKAEPANRWELKI